MAASSGNEYSSGATAFEKGGGSSWHAAQQTPSGSSVATGVAQRLQALPIHGRSAWQPSQIGAARTGHGEPQNTHASGITACSILRPNRDDIASNLAVNGAQRTPVVFAICCVASYNSFRGFHKESVVT